jgi:two-component system, NarL family, invasion response regulator UvrY
MAKKLLIVDDHALIRRGLRSLLEADFRGVVILEAENGEQALALISENHFDAAILDISLPSRSGLDVLKDIRELEPGLPVIMLSVHAGEQYAARCLRAGASAYLSKDEASDILTEALRAVLKGEVYMPTAFEGHLAAIKAAGVSTDLHEGLSDREFQVLCAIALGKSVSMIAEELGISVKTVSTYRQRVLEKMRMTSNAELTRYAIDHQMIA